MDNGLAHLQVAVLVEIGVDDAGTGLDDRDTGGVAYKVNKFPSATGDAEVHVAHSIEHLARSLMGGGQQGNDILRHTILLQYLMDEGNLLAIATIGILTALQHTGVTALETEREDIKRNIRTCLVNHANDTKRHTDTTETQTIRQRFLFGDMSEGSRKGGDIPHIGGNAFQTTLRQLKTVIKGIVFRHLGQVLGICL